MKPSLKFEVHRREFAAYTSRVGTESVLESTVLALSLAMARVSRSSPGLWETVTSERSLPTLPLPFNGFPACCLSFHYPGCLQHFFRSHAV